MQQQVNLIYEWKPNRGAKSIEEREMDRTLKRGWLRTCCADSQNWKCAYCGETMNLDTKSRKCVTLEHVTPRSMGGLDEYDNCVAACSRCNNMRASKPLGEGYKLQTDTLLREPSEYLGQLVRRCVRLLEAGKIYDVKSFNIWFESKRVSRNVIPDLVKFVRSRSDQTLTFLDELYICGTTKQ